MQAAEQRQMVILGIESSCDETSVALLENGVVRANEIYSQQVHSALGGVVPEIASRAHLRKIDGLCAFVLEETNCALADIDLIAVTDSPGLAGALLVGIAFALGLHVGYGIRITGVNHLEGHICSILIEHDRLSYPFLALVVSGGHTAIYRVENIGTYHCLGQTVDDAAGEAFDKVGKLIGFRYPAGQDVEREARMFSSHNELRFPVARLSTSALDFSFSGLKTAVKYFLQSKDRAFIEDNRPRICQAFQKAIVDSLVQNITAASRETGIEDIVLVGGVACNGSLRQSLRNVFGDRVRFPSPALCTDNAAMIARAGYERAIRNITRFPHMAPSGRL